MQPPTPPDAESDAPAAAPPEPTVFIAPTLPIDGIGLSIAILAVLAVVYALHWAREVVIPLLLGVTFSYALEPALERLERWRVPRVAGAAVLVLGIVGALGWGAYSVRDDATKLIASLPDATQKVRQVLQANRRNATASPIEKVQQAANELEKAAAEGAPKAPQTRGVTRVTIEKPHFDISEYLWKGTLGLVTAAGQAVVIVFLTFFLLVEGSNFRRKLVRRAGNFAHKRITVQALDEITEQIQRYLLVQVFTSVLVGVTTAIAFAAIGFNQAIVWGVIAFALNFIPYLGSIVMMAVSALVAFVQFGTFNMALAVAAISLIVHTIAGNLLTPWLTSRTNRMNPVAVFVGVLAFGWLWGIWGLLLGVPILTTVKAVCDRVEGLGAIGEFLGS